MKPILRYPGSKWNIAEWIISQMPAHTTYLEPYFGSGAVFFNKPPAKIETINDLNGRVVNLFRVIREHPDELTRLVYFTPWARDEYVVSDEETEDPIENARRFLIRAWMAFGAKIDSKATWSQTIQGHSRSNARVREWQRLPDVILVAAERLKKVQIENRPATELIRQYKHPSVLIYCDPPYPLGTRTRRLYPDEMTDEDHLELLDLLDEHPGPVLLSTYENEMYNERLRGWTKKTRKATAEKGRTREEVLWLNEVAARVNISLFQGI